MDFGINLGFAIKRWPQPDEWAALVRERLGLDLVQFSFDLLDPWWPEHRRLAAHARAAAEGHGIRIHSAQVGLAKYTYNGLLHPDPDARSASAERCVVPVRYVLDVGHALFQPLYGREVALADWLGPLAQHIGVLHLQNTDFASDSHWGWPDERGLFDVSAFAADVRAAGLADVP